ncbi:3,4-dihydroxy-2-butanone-4-phosphate synthase [Actinomycetota bacterium]
MRPLDTIETALDALRSGRPVLVVDDADRENEGDVILAAETLTEEWVAWTVRHTSGYLCAPMTGELADRLELPLMVERTEDPLSTAYTVSVDARHGVTTGISAADRTRTLRVLADPASVATGLRRPGHILPLRARDGGVLERPGHTEAAVDLCRLAGLAPVGCIGELVLDSGEMMRLPEVLEMGSATGLPVISIADLRVWRQRHDRVDLIDEARLPTDHGVFRARAYRDRLTGAEHLALVSPLGLTDQPLVRVHSECLTGDVLGSRRCDCGPQLTESMARVAHQGGVVVYVRGHEGRGVGLGAKIAAYALQDKGADTVDAQTQLGLPIDAREYAAAAAILRDLGCTGGVRLLTNNPLKVAALEDDGLGPVTRVPLVVGLTPENVGYVETKRARLGHLDDSDHPTTTTSTTERITA